MHTDRPGLLDGWVRRVNPAYDALLAQGGWPYYWSADQTEWATDVLFRTPEDLKRLYPRWLQQGIERMGCRDVLRFLRRKAMAVSTTAALPARWSAI